MSDEKKTLTVDCHVTAANIKKIDCDAYGITKRAAWVTFEIDGQKQTINCAESEIGKLDPTFEMHVTFEVKDPETQKIYATFGMADRQLGDKMEYGMNNLKDGIWVPKGMAVPGGSVSLQLKAHGFGAPDEQDDDDTWMM
eukprot:TRINITY_DN68365_c0_g1_i1.p1 TRINITY_DN68365_c0_g1~~TRINITY_DN68365_c0_g1_i1.p1  ORF type:complete len:140 (-),score=44.88 TRINITY_DN68365_c0_g1_i1:633-1052(-)